MSLAMVLTVRDERPTLRSNLLYHRFLGVERAYVFDDGSTDGTAASVADLGFVHLLPMAAPAPFPAGQAPVWAAQLSRQHPARQSLNALAAMEQARRDGCDWLLHLDPDEFVCLDADAARPGGLSETLSRLPRAVEAAHFDALEAVQRPSAQARPFARETLFKADRSGLRRPMYDPLRRLTWELEGFYGHHLGKSAVRLAADARPLSPHRFLSTQNTGLETRTLGHLLHFHAHSFEDWIRKYRRMLGRPDHYVSGDRVERHKRVWRELVSHPDQSLDDLRGYYERWLAMGDGELLSLQASLLEIRSLAEALDALAPVNAESA